MTRRYIVLELALLWGLLPFGVRAEPSVVINEIMYNPASDQAGDEFVELHNPTGKDLDISGWRFTEGIDYIFPQQTVHPSGGFLVLSKSPEQAAKTYGILDAYGPFGGRLNDSGEQILLADAEGHTVESFAYRDEHGWPQTADGQGPSLERRHPRMSAVHYQSWAAGPAGGTPGRSNASAVPLPEPVVWDVVHQPMTPSPSQEVQVTCHVESADPLSAVTLLYREDGETVFAEIPMEPNANGLYQATIGPADQDVIQEFAIQAVSTASGIGRFPTDAPTRTAVFQVDGNSYPSDLPLYRIVMHRQLEKRLFSRDPYSNEQLDACFYAQSGGYYNVGVRFRGKGSRGYPVKSYRVDFTGTERFGNIRKLNLNAQRPEIQLLGLEFFKRAGMPGPTCQLVSLIFNNKYVREYIQVERCDKDMMRRLFRTGSGNLYRGVEHGNFDYRGEDKARYRQDYAKQTNERQDDFSDVIDLCAAFSNTSDAEFIPAIEERINVEEWLRWFAIKAVLNDEEGGICNSDRGDDYYIYHKPEDHLFYILPWDLDSVLMNSNQTLFPSRVRAIRRLLTHPAFAPRYYSQVASLKTNEFEESRMAADIALLAPIVGPERRAVTQQVVHERHADIEAMLPTELTVNVQRSGGKRTIFKPGDIWRFFRGRREPSGGTIDWTKSGFDDSAWETGPAGIGFGDNDDATVLNDMRNNYVSVYMRFAFELEDAVAVSSLIFTMDYDDSFVAYLNGHEVARNNVSGDPPLYQTVADGNHEASGGDSSPNPPDVIDLRNAVQYIVPGRNVFAVQGHNVSRTSSDFSLIPTLEAGLSGNDVKLYGTAPATKTSSVTVNGQPANYVVTEGTWDITVKPQPGMSEFVVEARGPEGTVAESTVARLYMPGAGVSIGGSLDGDAHLKAGAGPYYFGDDLVVPWGTILTIDAGAQLLLAQGVGITVYGQMFVNGTPTSPVPFLVEGWRGRWKGIAFDRSSGESVLKGCDFSYGSQAEAGGQRFNGVIAARSTALTVEECVFTHLVDKGIEVTNGKLTARDCLFNDLGEGIHCTASSALIESCTFSGLRGHEDAIDLDDDQGQPSVIRKVAVLSSEDDGFDIGSGTVLMDSCRLSGAADKGISVEGTGLKTITNCIITGNDIGIEAKHNGEIRVVNCTITGNRSLGIHLLEEDPGAGGGKGTVLNTILWNNNVEIGSDTRSVAQVSYSDVQGGFPGENVTDADPLFLDAARGDFRLAALSPCADKGSGVGAPPVDYDGQPRPLGSGYDLGAFEREGQTGIAGWELLGP